MQWLPWGHDVDVNSVIELEVRQEQLKPLIKLAGLPAGTAGIGSRGEKLEALLNIVGGYTDQRTKTLEAWANLEATPETERDSSGVRAATDAEIENFDKLILEIAGRVEELWPGGSDAEKAESERVNGVIDAWLTAKDPSEFQHFLQQEIDRLRADTARALDRARAQAVRLRIEAFVLSKEAGTEPVAMAVPHYNDIAQKSSRSLDRWGLALTEAERKSLNSAITAVREVAEAAEKVRLGEATFEEAFSKIRSEQVAKLTALVTELEQLASELESSKLEARVADTKAALERFQAALQIKLGNRVASERAALRTELDQALAGVDRTRAGVAALLSLIEGIKEVRGMWNTRDLSNLENSVSVASGLITDANTLLESRADLLAALEELGKDVKDRIESRGEGLAADVKSDVLEVYGDADVGLQKDLKQWQRLAARVRSAIQRVITPAKILSGLEDYAPLPLTVRAPSPIDPLLENAPNTALDLTRIERQAGDQLEIRASLIEGDEVQGDPLIVRLDLEKLGWHADPVPAVVLVTADQLAGADDSGGFSASLSWMLRYGPRNEERDFLAKSSRLLGWGVGPHATLLNFDSENDAEIGLGVTIGFWEDLLLFGAGINVLAEDANDGRGYFFIGSSLIPLLQAMD